MKKRFLFPSVLTVLLVFLAMAALLLGEGAGLRSHPDRMLPPAQITVTEDDRLPSCLVLTDLSRDDCMEAAEQFRQILKDIRVPVQFVDLNREAIPHSLELIRTVVVLTPDLSVFGDSLIFLLDWVHDGGQVLFAMPMEKSPHAAYVQQRAAVLVAADFFVPTGYCISADYMLGGGQTYALSGSHAPSLVVNLRPEASVYVRNESEDGLPLVWSAEYGQGRIAVNNIGSRGPAFRGFYSAAYSLLEDVSVQPVLNGASLFLELLPDVSAGAGRSEDFYTSVWLRDMQQFSQNYTFPMVGLVSNAPERDWNSLAYIGNIFLHSVNELGYSRTSDDPDSIAGLRRLCAQLFPAAQFTLFADGDESVLSPFTEIRTVSGVYLPDSDAKAQEFGVNADGIVSLPRITSGYAPDGDMQLAALSELNLHMVFSHTLPEAAESVWPAQYRAFLAYMNWLEASAPGIRHLNSRDMSAAIQRWAMLTVDTDIQGNTMTIHLGNFADEAFLAVRFNHCSPAGIEGGVLTVLNETLCLLEASQADITIYLDR